MRDYLFRKGGRFVAIVGGGIVVAAVIWVATNVFNLALPGQNTTPIQVRLLVAPAAYDWVNEAAEHFNRQGKRFNRQPITIVVVEKDGLSVYNELDTTSLTPPTAWIAEGAFTLDLVNQAGRQSGGRDLFAAETNLAQSPLMWGGFSERVVRLDARFGGLNWSAVRGASADAGGWSSLGGQADWGFFKPALPDPRKSSEGLAALLSAAAEFHNKTDLSAADIESAQFQTWAQALVDAVPNFASLGSNPGDALAVRGPSAGDVGLLLESDWLNAAEGLSKFQPVFRYAPAAVAFDFPFAVWVGPSLTPASDTTGPLAAARMFRDYLLEDGQQLRAPAFGLRPVNNAVNVNDSLFVRWATLGFQAGTPPTTRIHAGADAVLALVRWAERAVGP